jgi:hypothetical protein
MKLVPRVTGFNGVVARIRPLDVLLLVELFLLCVAYSRTYNFFPETRTFINLFTLLVPLAFVPFVLRSRPVLALCIASVVALIFGYQAYFSSLWGTEFTGEAIGSYQGLMLGALIALHARTEGPARFLKVFFIAAFLYLILYLYLYTTIDATHILSQQAVGGSDYVSSIRRTHESREGLRELSEFKIGTSGPIMTYLVLYSAALVMSRKSIAGFAISFGLFAIAALGMWKSDSRFNTAVSIVACVVMLIPASSRIKAHISFGLAALGIVAYIAFAMAPVNPFSFLNFDASGAARMNEFDVANPVFRRTPLLGIGLKNTVLDYEAVFTGDVAATDLGWYGDLIQFGIVGMLLFLWTMWLVVRYISRLSDSRADSLSVRVITAFFAYLVGVQFITPQFWQGAGAIMLSLALAAPIAKLTSRMHLTEARR